MAVDGKVIVEDELSNVLVVKMKPLSQDDVILPAVNHIGLQRTESSKQSSF